VVDLTEGEAPPAVSSAGLTAPPAGSAAQGMCQNDNLRQTAGIKFAHRPKIRFLAPQGRLVAPIHVRLGMADGQLGPLGCAKFHLNQHGVGMRPTNIKNFHFLVKSCLAGANPLTDF